MIRYSAFHHSLHNCRENFASHSFYHQTIQKNYEALRYNKIDLRELKIPPYNEILTPNRFFYFRPSECNIFSIARRPRGQKKPQIHCYLCRTIIKHAVCTNWCGVCLFHTWRFLSSPILEICIFFLPIL